MLCSLRLLYICSFNFLLLCIIEVTARSQLGAQTLQCFFLRLSCYDWQILYYTISLRNTYGMTLWVGTIIFLSRSCLITVMFGFFATALTPVDNILLHDMTTAFFANLTEYFCKSDRIIHDPHVGHIGLCYTTFQHGAIEYEFQSCFDRLYTKNCNRWKNWSWLKIISIKF